MLHIAAAAAVALPDIVVSRTVGCLPPDKHDVRGPRRPGSLPAPAGCVNQLFTVMADGSGATQLTNCTHGCVQPSWSPDGRYIQDGVAWLREQHADPDSALYARVDLQQVAVGGWSMGGVVAFEMALQLAAAGKRVDQLILMDSPAPINGMPVFTKREQILTFGDDMLSCRKSLTLPNAAESDALSALSCVMERVQKRPRLVSLGE